MQSNQTKKISKQQKRKQGKDANKYAQMKMMEEQKNMILYSRPIEEIKAEQIHHAFVLSGKKILVL